MTNIQWDAQFYATMAELLVAIINIIATTIYYWKRQLTVISYCHMLFGVVLLSNQIITSAMAFEGNTTYWCFVWYLQASLDWIFTIRVYYIEQKKWVKYSWIALFVLMDALPRIIGQFFYTTSVKPSGICVLYKSAAESLVKTTLDTMYIGIVAIYFTFKIFRLIQPTNGGIGVQSLESLTVTSVAFAIALCLIRTLIGIPFILDIWPTVTPYLIPLEMILLPPICFLSIAYGSKLRVNILPKSNTGSMEMKSFRSNTSSLYIQPGNTSSRPAFYDGNRSAYSSPSSPGQTYSADPLRTNSGYSFPPTTKRSEPIPQYF
ncbi:hypothetical protein HDV06_001664 [Boothiomyces sp. JEL0866]|nr:hypothetical protein HDV06_001664 [Boothiomyces sp. JEL0866]